MSEVCDALSAALGRRLPRELIELLSQSGVLLMVRAADDEVGFEIEAEMVSDPSHPAIADDTIPFARDPGDWLLCVRTDDSDLEFSIINTDDNSVFATFPSVADFVAAATWV